MKQYPVKKAPEWHKLIQQVGVSGKMRTLCDHLADISEYERKCATGSYIHPGAKFCITSDGYALVDFVDSNGKYRPGSFWGSWGDTVSNVMSLADFLSENFDTDEDDKGFRAGQEIGQALRSKIGVNYQNA